MSNVEEAVVVALQDDPTVLALITKDRIFQHKLAQGSALPALTYQLIDDSSINSQGGSSGLARARIQFDCWGKTKEEASAVALAVRMALVGIKRYSSGVLLQGGFKISEMSMFDPDVRLRRRVLDMYVWHSEEN